MDWQVVSVVLIVTASAVYLARSFWRILKGGGCTHGCLPQADPRLRRLFRRGRHKTRST